MECTCSYLEQPGEILGITSAHGYLDYHSDDGVVLARQSAPESYKFGDVSQPYELHKKNSLFTLAT